MNSVECGRVRELIPRLARRLEREDVARAGKAPIRHAGPTAQVTAQVEAHLAACRECRAELELARALFRSRPAVPEGLADRIVMRLRQEREGARHPAWALTAAAIAALALGIGLHGDVPDPDAPPFAQEPAETWTWDPEDGVVAGAPMLDDLTDQDLTVLLTSLSTE